MRFLLVLAFLPSLAFAQTMVLACQSPWGSAQNCLGCSGVIWSAPDANDQVKSDATQFWKALKDLPPTAKVDVATGKAEGASASCAQVTGTKLVSELLGTTPEPPGPPAWTGSSTINWTLPTKNTDGSALSNLSGFRLYYGKTNPPPSTQLVQVPIPTATTHTLTGLTAGTWYVALTSYTPTSESALTSVLTLVATPPVDPPPTCPAMPAVESRTQTCVAPLIGSWTQSKGWTSAAYPTCWVEGAWLPATAPAGVCATPPPTNRVTADTSAYELRGTTANPTLTLIGLVPLGATCGPQTQVVKGVTYCRVSLWRGDGSLQVAVISFPIDLKLTGAWAKAQ